MNRSPAGVDQQTALAAYGLADQRQLTAGSGAEVEHRRVELDELDVAQPRTRPQRGSDPVAGGYRRVGGHGVDLADASGGQDDRPGVNRADPAAGALAEHVQGDPGDGRRLPRRRRRPGSGPAPARAG